MLDIVINFISIFSNVLWLAIFIRALMSWVMPRETGGLLRVLVEITEPVLAPIRRVLPPLGGFDLSPIVAIIVIQVVSQALIRMIANSAG